jgi:hypothetical protein
MAASAVIRRVVIDSLKTLGKHCTLNGFQVVVWNAKLSTRSIFFRDEGWAIEGIRSGQNPF